MPSDRAYAVIRPISLYILAMLVAVMVMGVVYREVSKYYGSWLPEEMFILATHYLSLAHGHVLSLGVVIPSAILLVSLAIDHVSGLGEGAVRSLRRAFVIYVIGSLAAISLLIYKGIGILYYYSQDPAGGLTAANEALFLGSHALREGLYGTAHLVMFAGLIYAVYVLATQLSKGTVGGGAGSP